MSPVPQGPNADRTEPTRPPAGTGGVSVGPRTAPGIDDMGMRREDHPAFGGTYQSGPQRRRELLDELAEVVRAELLAAGVITRDPGAPVPATHDPSPVKLAHWRVLHKGNKARYRVGGKLGRTLYAQLGHRPDESDLFLATFDYAEVAHAFARALNQATGRAREERFRDLVDSVNARCAEVREAVAKYSAPVGAVARSEPMVCGGPGSDHAHCAVDETAGGGRDLSQLRKEWSALADGSLLEVSSLELVAMVRGLATELLTRTDDAAMAAETAKTEPVEACPPPPPPGVYKDRFNGYRLWTFRRPTDYRPGTEQLWYPHDLDPPVGGRLWPMTWPKAWEAGADPAGQLLRFTPDGPAEPYRRERGAPGREPH